MTKNETGIPPSEATSATEFDVIIVGLGPVGGTLAALLGVCGVSACRRGQKIPATKTGTRVRLS